MTYHVQNYKYIYDLPYIQYEELCEILNHDNKWEELAGHWMGYKASDVERFRFKKNPTDEILKQWGYMNHSIYELFVLLAKMKHYQAMLLLKNFVDSRLHVLLYDYEKNILKNRRDETNKETEKVQKTETVQNVINNPMSKIFTMLPNISYYELTVATDDWKKENLIGTGGFGMVYKGFWKNTSVAIKKIKPKGFDYQQCCKIQLEQSFKEITILNSLPHENILPLYAYSVNSEVPCLVYKYMMNGSLEDRILLKHETAPLNWTQRQEIAKGVARGLQYMHTVRKNPLIHGDIKSANILLDNNFEPKIGDFGLARIGSSNSSVKVSKVVGTKVYLPDDYIFEQNLSTKIDTYSYGILLFELATGLQGLVKNLTECKSLKEHVDSFIDKDLHQLKDIKAGEEFSSVYDFLINLGKWCSNKKAKNRPEMIDVFEKFN